MSPDITQNLWRAPDSLQVLIDRAGIQPYEPVVYDGSAAAMPRWKFHGQWVNDENNWLPTPVQLLEEPITPERRRVILARYIHRRRLDGYFIQAKGPNEPQTIARAPGWYALIEQSHQPIRVYENDSWKITRYIAKPEQAP